MVIRASNVPRLPRMYWGELIYATPGCGKTFVANKYRDVVDGDDLIVKAIRDVNPSFSHGLYDDPREVIFRFFRYIQFNRRIMWKVYNAALRKMKSACDIDDVVLFGTMDLMHEADRIFIEKDDDRVRNGFEDKQWREEENADDSDVPVHEIYEYLDNSLQRTCRGY
mmetsp:Transcript_33069/g.76205  ORF Transcript_33069/g.76205 Transcript_33069/m.76205 type:complete len:167 (-) Transcript_33069:936-1436(-)